MRQRKSKQATRTPTRSDEGKKVPAQSSSEKEGNASTAGLFFSKFLFPLLPLLFCYLGWSKIQQPEARSLFLCTALFSIAAYVATFLIIPTVKPLCIKANLFGKDLAKVDSDQIPESLGIVCAGVFLVCAILFQPLFASTATLGLYNACLTTLAMMLFLGFADDVLDLRWRVKILFSFMATLPLLVVYDGPTTALVPTFLRPILGFSIVELGSFYILFMALLAVFCSNAINIYAGVNGLEVGQSVIICIFIIIHNLIDIDADEPFDHLLFSLHICIFFLATLLALFYYNWFPSSVFVGDSFTYFAGTIFAVVGITVHFSKSLLILFIPQLLNFIISLPQLFFIIPCPRHRVPRFNRDINKMEYTKNLTLLNAFLYVTGPLREDHLVIVLLSFQVFCCTLALFVRFYISTLLY